MDLDVADMSMGSLMRRAGDADSPLSSNPASASPRQRRRPGQQRRASPVVRAAILRRATAGQRRATADTSIEQFARDQELAIDGSADSVDLNMSGSPSTRARSFLAHQRRSLSGEELATLLRELRTPGGGRTGGRRRLSVGVSRRHLAALGDDGVEALLELVDEGLDVFEGTMSASVAEDDTLTPTPSPEASAAADREDDDLQDSRAAGGDHTIMEESAGEGVGDKLDTTEEYDVTMQDRAGVEGEGEPDEESAEQDADAVVEDDPERGADAEHDVEGGDVQGTSAVAREEGESGIDRSRLRSSNVVQTPEVSALTPRAPLRQTPSLATRRGAPPARGGVTPSASGRSRLSQSLATPGSPSSRASLRQKPSPAERSGSAAGDKAAASSKDSRPITPVSKMPLRSLRTPASAGRSGARTPASAIRSGARTPASAGRSGARTPASALKSGGRRLTGSGRRVSGGRPGNTPSTTGSPVLRQRSQRLRSPLSVAHRETSDPPPEDDQPAGDAGDADDEPYDADAVFDTPLAPPLLEEAATSRGSGARSALATPRSKATPRGGSARKNYGSMFERFFADGRQGHTSTPRSEPPRRPIGGARPSPLSKSLFVVTVPPQGRTPGRLSLAMDVDERPAPRYTSGVIADPDEVGSDVSEEFPSETGGGAAGSPRLRSAGSGRISQLSADSRAAGTPFVPSAESTRLSLRPAGAPPPADADDPAGASDTDDPTAAGPSARSPAAPAAGHSAAPAGTPASRRSLRASSADGTAPAAADTSRPPPKSASRPPPKSASRRRSAANKPSAQEAFARLFPTYQQDQQQRREEAAAAKQHRSSVVRKPTKRSSLFGKLKTRRWFRQSAVGLRVTPEALREVDAAMEKFERLVRGWLRQVTGPRRAPTQSDVLAVLRRSGVAGSEPELRRLIRQHMMMEEQQELIRVAESGDRLYPADNPLVED